MNPTLTLETHSEACCLSPTPPLLWNSPLSFHPCFAAPVSHTILKHWPSLQDPALGTDLTSVTWDWAPQVHPMAFADYGVLWFCNAVAFTDHRVLWPGDTVPVVWILLPSNPCQSGPPSGRFSHPLCHFLLQEACFDCYLLFTVVTSRSTLSWHSLSGQWELCWGWVRTAPNFSLHLWGALALLMNWIERAGFAAWRNKMKCSQFLFVLWLLWWRFSARLHPGYGAEDHSPLLFQIIRSQWSLGVRGRGAHNPCFQELTGGGRWQTSWQKRSMAVTIADQLFPMLPCHSLRL